MLYCSQHAHRHEEHVRELSTKHPGPPGETADARESERIIHAERPGWAADDAAKVPVAAVMLSFISMDRPLPPFA